MAAKKAIAAVPKTLPIRKKRKPAARVKKPKEGTRSFLQRREDVFRAAGFSKKNIASFRQEEGARLLAAGEKRMGKAAAATGLFKGSGKFLSHPRNRKAAAETATPP